MCSIDVGVLELIWQGFRGLLHLSIQTVRVGWLSPACSNLNERQMGVCVNTNFFPATKTLTFCWQQPRSRLDWFLFDQLHFHWGDLCGVNKMSHLISLRASSDLETCAKFHWNRLTPAQRLKTRVITRPQFSNLSVSTFTIIFSFFFNHFRTFSRDITFICTMHNLFQWYK